MSLAAAPASPTRPVRLRRSDLLFALWIGWRAMVSFSRHEATVLSGYIAFAGLLALFPFLIFATSLLASTIGPDEIEALVTLLFEFAPPEVASELDPALRRILEQPREGVLTVAGLGALFAASSGVEAFRTAFDRAYEVPETRNLVVNRLIGMGLVLAGTVAAAVLGFAVVLAPLLIDLAQTQLGVETPWGAGLIRYGLAVLTLAVFLYAMHLALPAKSWRGVARWPGILTTIAVWTAAATAFSWYLALAPSFSATYGALSGVIVTLLFFYLSGAVIIYGAEVNAALLRARRMAAAEVAAAEAPPAVDQDGPAASRAGGEAEARR